MSEEEKKAIETTKIMIKYVGDNYIPKQNREKLKILLNLIEKLQKENEEIREWKFVIDNPIDLKKLSELDLIKIFGKSYIAVDKIKAKIEELENKSLDDLYKRIGELEELLEE